MANLKPKQIIGITIALLLLGILLPIGLNEIVDFSDSELTNSSQFTSQSTPTNYSVSLRNNERLSAMAVNGSGDLDHLNITVYYANNHSVAIQNNTLGDSVFVKFNSTAAGTVRYVVAVQNQTGGTVNYNLTIVRDFWVEFDDSIITLISQIIPVVAVVGIIMVLIPNKRN
jgi:hypothetical protein